MPRIITIAREYGSGGRLIAQKVAQKVGLVYYDNEVIDLAAREMGMDVDAIRKVAEQKSSSFMYTMSSSAFSLPLNDQVFVMQSKIIRHLANHDSCIIVNGCADYILEDVNVNIKFTKSVSLTFTSSGCYDLHLQSWTSYPLFDMTFL